jgi:site-specific recombinase XerD
MAQTSSTLAPLAPADYAAIQRFGKGSERKLRQYMMMLAAFLESKGANTKRAYRAGLQQFFGLFEWISPEDVTAAHAAAFKKWLLETRKVSDTTAYLRLSAVASFFDFLCLPHDAVSEPLLRHNPIRTIDRSDIQPTPYARSKAMEWETLQKIMDALPADVGGIRDKAILLFFAFTGRRRAEVTALRIRDLRLDTRPRSYTTRVKGGKLQTFELPDLCYDAIRAYWMISDRLATLRPDSAVFAALPNALTGVARTEEPMSPRSINRVLERAARHAGVDSSDAAICIHAIRHMAARDLDREGVRLQDIQSFLGHASPVTTQVYLDRIGKTRSAHTDVLTRAREKARELGRSLTQT